ncbi:hypothetical protein KDW_06960 [Dictyobacter vulcani]|uniref:Uncharacterized protein n=1 Tax=Dictyobacter vulcani TaxID=2607529 RepID=A0A5J4KCG1_9CHLR|nr:hypothetical protein [Dictyobacter vulcani]GER86534.1 hypothetical protein KDW_06960 [Dictyobacter vulcani]
MIQIEKEKSPYTRAINLGGLTTGTSASSERLRESVLSSALEFSCGSSSFLTGNTFLSQRDFRKVFERTVSDTLADISKLVTLQSVKHNYDALPPTWDSVAHAHSWIQQLLWDIMSLRKEWIKPNVTASEDGEVVFEWWNKEKKLTIYIDDRHAEYIKVWGININSEMSDGSADSISTCQSLWLWLIS